ncbi:MAG: helix-turn-helix transcriptional regulator [Myxococcales bacterium]|nr:helix-turn-helix transcriptional regulator [Myxococcales bacterium]
MRLNDSGTTAEPLWDRGLAHVVSGGATHYSCSQQTSEHAHYAWKIHVGLDAPVWLRSSARTVDTDAEARVVVAPPNVHHSTGAVGLSIALFAAPGSRGTPWRATREPFAIGGAAGRRLVAMCQELVPADPQGHVALVDAVFASAIEDRPQRLDARVGATLAAIARDPNEALAEVARWRRLSLDQLSRLVSQQTGMRLRRHVLWARLLDVLSTPAPSASLAEAAVAAGFSDHAHMTRTFRAFLGRAPSELMMPPAVVAPWLAAR